VVSVGGGIPIWGVFVPKIEIEGGKELPAVLGDVLTLVADLMGDL